MGARLGVPCSAAEQACSLRPCDYAYAAPSAATLQRLQRELGNSLAAAGAPAAAPAIAAGSLPGALGEAAAPFPCGRSGALPRAAAPAPRGPSPRPAPI